ncbi:MAG TPA: OmpA family protein [Geminicoccaceae bacterium]
MKGLLFGVSLFALVASGARAQEAGTYLVYFDLDRSTLTADGRQVVQAAANEYRQTGTARVSVSGHADLSGSGSYNEALSQRRAETVRRELVRLGVPAASISTVAEGETDPAVQTPDGTREARNRRVEIMIPQPAVAQAPAPPAAPSRTAEAPPPPAPEPEDKDRFVVSIAPVYGHNFLEDDENETEDDLAGLEFTFNALPGFLGGLSLKQGVFHSFNAVDEGFAGRSVLSLDFAPDLGVVRPRLSLNGGGVYGHGVQDGFVVGPELALDINLFGGFTLRPKVAYDYQFRNPEWDEGILWAGLDLGIRF